MMCVVIGRVSCHGCGWLRRSATGDRRQATGGLGGPPVLQNNRVPVPVRADHAAPEHTSYIFIKRI